MFDELADTLLGYDYLVLKYKIFHNSRDFVSFPIHVENSLLGVCTRNHSLQEQNKNMNIKAVIHIIASYQLTVDYAEFESKNSRGS